MSHWTPAQADAHLDALRDVGWHLGLERMAELCDRLGNPQRRFRVIHVVGTNGKSSVAELCRRLLAGAGVRAGAYLSPHLGSWSERIRLPSGEEPMRYAAAVEEAASVAGEIGPTQFELATAAALLALAEDGAEVAAIEAGMGGRLDATNVCEAEVVALTNVDLDHTQWLGETIAEIAAEKLGVVGHGATLVVGRLGEDAMRAAEAASAAKGARLIQAFAATDRTLPHLSGQTPIGWDFTGENVLVAQAAVAALLARDISLTDTAHGSVLPARAELIDGDPPVLLDLAHNPAGAAALVRHPGLAGRTVIACVALLDDKDLPGFAAALAPAVDEVIATETGPLPGSARPGARAHPARAVQAAFEAAGVARASALDAPRDAVEATLSAARKSGGLALITGSHYLLRHPWIPGRDRSFST